MNQTLRVLLPLAALIVWTASAVPAPAADGVSVVSVEGGKLTRKGKALALGAVLKNGETIKLSAGRAILRVGASGHVLVKGRSSFAVGPGGKPGFFLRLGAMLSALPRLDRRGFSLRTPAAVAAVRGTDFYVEARGTDESYVCACLGRIDVSDAADERPKGFPLASEHHAARVYRKGAKGLVESGADMLGHSDDERSELHALDAKTPGR